MAHTNTNEVTFKKATTGEFDVLLDGRLTNYTISIVNSCLGGLSATGDTKNMYRIVRPNGTSTTIGSLSSAKKMVSVWVLRHLQQEVA